MCPSPQYCLDYTYTKVVLASIEGVNLPRAENFHLLLDIKDKIPEKTKITRTSENKKRSHKLTSQVAQKQNSTQDNHPLCTENNVAKTLCYFVARSDWSFAHNPLFLEPFKVLNLEYSFWRILNSQASSKRLTPLFVIKTDLQGLDLRNIYPEAETFRLSNTWHAFGAIQQLC